MALLVRDLGCRDQMYKGIGINEAKNIATYQGKHVDGYSMNAMKWVENMGTEFLHMFFHSFSRINYTRQNTPLLSFISERLLCIFISLFLVVLFCFYYLIKLCSMSIVFRVIYLPFIKYRVIYLQKFDDDKGQNIMVKFRELRDKGESVKVLMSFLFLPLKKCFFFLS